MSDRTRITGALKFSRKYEFIQDLHQIHEDSWDDRFYLDKLPPYSSSRDKYSTYRTKDHLNIRSLDKLSTRSLRTTSTQSFPKTLTNASAFTKGNLPSNHEQLSTLHEQLETAWEAHQTPLTHRKAFLAHLLETTPYQSASIIAKELEELRSGRSPIQEILRVVSSRESVVKRLEELSHEITQQEPMRSIQQLEAVELLAELRLKSIQVVESMMKWREQLNNYTLVYDLDGHNYFHKMKTDVEFIPNSLIGQLVSLPENFSTFLIQSTDIRNVLNSGRSSRLNSSKISIPISHNVISRLKLAEHIISKPVTSEFSELRSHILNPSLLTKSQTQSGALTPHIKKSISDGFKKFRSSAPLNLRNKQNVVHSTRRIIKQEPKLQSTFKKEFPKVLVTIKQESETSADVSIDRIPEDIMTSLSDYIFNRLIVSEVDNKVLPAVTECFTEMVSASLVLFSSSVLDKYIFEILNEQIPQIANDAYNEILDCEYIDFQAQIMKEVKEEELTLIVQHCIINILSDALTEEYSHLVDIQPWIIESIQEENSWNERIITAVFENLMEELISEDWLEIMAEEEVSDARMEENWALLPANVQKQLLKTEGSKIQGKLYEKIYFDILNKFVATIWLNGILKESEEEVRLGESTMSLQQIMPLEEIDERGVRRGRKSTIINWQTRKF